ncbi:hypothetical protein BJ878DRAFT_577875 [Calycina marina]|uniref:Uncharacterized protein n=1 Tax=Calycina marina TaxID=1763456 RepID=A0A9P7YXK4_9HELO|nr:hypothetical protein BJ878DRAFT_577875 [Calycina marina]
MVDDTSTSTNGDPIAAINDGVNHLDRMPPEIREKIFGYAIKLDNPIVTRQLKERSNIFTWIRGPMQKLPRPISITTERALEVRSVITVLKAGKNLNNRPLPADVAWASLRACHNLEYLEIVFDPLSSLWDTNQGYNFQAKQFVTEQNMLPDQMVAVRGLKELKITVPSRYYGTEEAALRKAMAQEKSKTYIPSKHLTKLQEWASLDIHGSGRLGKDRKPGVISNRTRGSVKKVVNELGIIDKQAPSKYVANGNLMWEIDAFTDVREVDDDIYPVEFLCRLRYRDNTRFLWVMPTVDNPLWESVGVLDSATSRTAIAEYHQAHPSQPGKQVVLDLWKGTSSSYADSDESAMAYTSDGLSYITARKMIKVAYNLLLKVNWNQRAGEAKSKAEADRVAETDKAKKGSGTARNATPKKVTAKAI